MKHLVIAVSAESSIQLLSLFADVLLLDKGPVKASDIFYDTVYIRSHFGQQSTLPQNFRDEIDSLVLRAININPNVKFIDGMDTVDAILAFEDKWLQYKTFGKFMPLTELFHSNLDISNFTRPVYKNRLSSNGSGVTWDKERTSVSPRSWIVQETLDIQEELRVYVMFGEVFNIGAVRQSMTEGSKAQGVSYRSLTKDEIQFSLRLMQKAPGLDIVGLDIARTSSGELRLIEVNRSPGFAKFHELTSINLADIIYEK